MPVETHYNQNVVGLVSPDPHKRIAYARYTISLICLSAESKKMNIAGGPSIFGLQTFRDSLIILLGDEQAQS